MTSTSTSQWLLYAIASGACAALNGVFAKLTTTQLTAAWASQISSLFGIDERSVAFEYLIRGSFFAMNLIFNGVMWGLFTRALTLSSSTVRVSVINTSANFVITAFLGALIFREELPGLWWLGASLLVAGSVIIGRREEPQTHSTVEKRAGLPSTEKDTKAATNPTVPSDAYTGNGIARTSIDTPMTWRSRKVV